MIERDYIWVTPEGFPTSRWKVIAKAIADEHGVTFQDIVGRSRLRKVTRARQHVYAALRDMTRLSYPEIGRRIGGRDHTSVLHGDRVHRARADAADRRLDVTRA